MRYGSYHSQMSRKGAPERSEIMRQTADRQGTWTIDYLTWRGDRNQGVVILDEDRCLSGGDSLYRYSGRYTVRDRTLLCDGVEMTPAHGGHVTPWGEEAPNCQVVLWGRMAGASIEGMMINPGNPHLRFRMTRQTH